MSENPRLCYFTYGTNAGHYHYALNQLRGLHETQPELDIDVIYAGTDHESHFPEYVSERHFVYTGGDRRISILFKTLVLQVRLLLYLFRIRPDVVHMNTHLRTQWYTLYVTVVLAILRVPVVRTIHERTDKRLQEIDTITSTLADVHFQLVDQLVTHTNALKKELAQDGVTTPVSVIPHGNYRCFRTHMDRSEPSPYGESDAPIVLFFGVKEHKGVDVFFDALEYAQTEFDAWVVGPVNEGDEEYARRAEADERVDTHFEFIPDEQLWKYFHFSDIVVLPYREGTTSGALQLALAFENAVIVSKLPCFTEYVTDGETAAVLQQYTSSTLAGCLDRLVTHPEERRRLAAAGFELSRSEQFDWRHLADQLVQRYETVAPETFEA